MYSTRGVIQVGIFLENEEAGNLQQKSRQTGGPPRKVAADVDWLNNFLSCVLCVSWLFFGGVRCLRSFSRRKAIGSWGPASRSTRQWGAVFWSRSTRSALKSNWRAKVLSFGRKSTLFCNTRARL